MDTNPDPQPAATPPAVPPTVPEDTLKSALTAFKKRIKLMILNEESKLGAGRPMTSGKKSDIQGIIPPNQFGPEVWRELAKQGKLKSMGGGFYRLP